LLKIIFFQTLWAHSGQRFPVSGKMDSDLKMFNCFLSLCSVIKLAVIIHFLLDFHEVIHVDACLLERLQAVCPYQQTKIRC
jgi:hypothetical protein